MALTLCRVARLGLSAGLLVVIQLSLCLIKSFVMPSALNFPSIFPCSSTARHRMARAVPTERSLPVGQQTSILLVESDGSEAKNSRSRGSWVRRSRDPSLPVWHLRWRWCFVPLSFGSLMSRDVGVHSIIASKSVVSMPSFDDIYTFLVGWISVAVTFPHFSSAINFLIILGAPSSGVLMSKSLFFQKSCGVSPWAQASWSSAAPCIYPFSEISAPCTRREAVHKTIGWKSGNDGGVEG